MKAAVLIELQRRGYELHYLRTPQGNEVDFHAIDATGQILLVQVCADATDPRTLGRETRSLLEAQAVHPDAQLLLLHLEALPAGTSTPANIEVVPALRWFLQTEL